MTNILVVDDEKEILIGAGRRFLAEAVKDAVLQPEPVAGGPVAHDEIFVGIALVELDEADPAVVL